MKLYLLKSVHDSMPYDLVPTMKEAKSRLNDFGGSGEAEIEKIDVRPTAKSVCNLINCRFGVAIFEN